MIDLILSLMCKVIFFSFFDKFWLSKKRINTLFKVDSGHVFNSISLVKTGGRLLKMAVNEVGVFVELLQ